MMDDQSKPRLGIRRPPSLPPNGANVDNAMVDRVRNRVRENSRREAKLRFRTRIRNLASIVFMLSLLGIGWIGYRWWSEKKMPMEVSTVISETKKFVEQVSPEYDDEPEPEMSDSVQDVAAFTRVANAFKGTQLSSWGKLDKGRRPGAVEGVFSLWVPYGKARGRFFEIDSSTKGIVSIIHRNEEGRSREVKHDEYVKMLTKRGGLLAKDGVSYFITAKNVSNKWNVPLRTEEPFDPAEAYFGPTMGMIGKNHISTVGVEFDVAFKSSPKSSSIRVCSAKFGEKVPYEKFKKATESVARRLHRANVASSVTNKSFRPTVVLYGGTEIVTDKTGITRVPRSSKHLTGASQDRWNRLYEEACKQEAKVKEVEEQARQMRIARQKQLEDSPTDAEIEQVLKSGSIILKRK